MSTHVSTHHIAGQFFADAHVKCDFCGAEAESRGAAGAGAKDDAIAVAKAHARVHLGWTATTVPVREGRKTLALVRDKCHACVVAA